VSLSFAYRGKETCRRPNNGVDFHPADRVIYTSVYLAGRHFPAVLAKAAQRWNVKLPLLLRSKRRNPATQSTNPFAPAAAVFASSFAAFGAVPDVVTASVKRAKAGSMKIDATPLRKIESLIHFGTRLSGGRGWDSTDDIVLCKHIC
jgi:hypothetical protein